MKATSLPAAGLRKYFADLIRNKRAYIRKMRVLSNADLFRKELAQAELNGICFAAKDLNFFCMNPEVLK